MNCFWLVIFVGDFSSGLCVSVFSAAAAAAAALLLLLLCLLFSSFCLHAFSSSCGGDFVVVMCVRRSYHNLFIFSHSSLPLRMKKKAETVSMSSSSSSSFCRPLTHTYISPPPLTSFSPFLSASFPSLDHFSHPFA